MDYENLLNKIGLNEKESKIYLALIEKGQMTIAGIAQSTGLHRPAIYKTLPKLLKQGLISMAPRSGKLKYFAAESPDKLKLLLDDLNTSFENALPNLAIRYRSSDPKPSVRFYIGRDGITQVYMDLLKSLKKDEVYYRYTTNTNLFKLESYLPRDYRRIRDAKHLQRFVITNTEFAKQGHPKLAREEKVMPSETDLFNYEISMLIYADKIAFIDFNTESAVIIENKKIAEFQRRLFKFVYNKL